MRALVGRTLLLIAASVAAAGAAAAQDCRGVPSQKVHLMAQRLELNDGTPSYTGEVGGHSGWNGLNLNYSTANIGNAGSVNRSMGLRIYRQRQGEWFAFCALIGYQLGFAYLKDVEGSMMNYRERARTVPVALPLAVRHRFLPGVTAGAWVSPQYLFQRSVGQLYDRGDTIKVDESPSAVATEMGVFVKFTTFFVRLSRFKRSDRDADIILGGGIAW